MRQVTIYWHGDALFTRTLPDRPVRCGEGAEVELPVPCFELPIRGDVHLGALLARVESLEDIERPAPPRRSFPLGSTFASAVVHAIAIAVIATSARLHPKDKKEEERERIQLMAGYMGRIAEHDALVPGDVASDDTSDARALEHGTRGGEITMESGEGEEASAGRALDARVPSLVPLDPKPIVTLGSIATPNHGSSPSTLGPKLARTPRSTSGHGVGGSGGGGQGAGGGSSCVAFAGSSLHDPKSNTWIEFQLVDTRGRPVPNERYRVTLPDGSVHEGLTDQRGLVCFTGIKPGDAKIEWPDVDATYKGSSAKPI